MENIETIVTSVVESLAVVNENGEITNMAELYKSLGEVVKALQATRKGIAEKAKDATKKAKEATKAENAEIGKEYVKTLSEGDEIQYTMADGSVITGTFVKISDKTATIRLPSDSPLLEGKNTERKNYDCRYVSFDKIVIPAVASEEEVA